MKNYTHRKHNKTAYIAMLIALVICLPNIMMFLGGCASKDPETEELTDCVSQTHNDRIQKEITSGYDLDETKPLPTQRIALKCYSFYSFTEKITVKASMGDDYSYKQEHNSVPTYDTYGTNGSPMFEVYPKKSLSYNAVDASTVLINKNNKEYRKEFKKDDLSKLDISYFKDDVSKYYYEDVELDLSNYAAGDTGTIVFSFGWYYDYPPYEDYLPEELWEGYRRFLYYYVADDGVYISFNSEESAREDANISSQHNQEKASEIENTIKDDALCTSKPLYLVCTDDYGNEYLHGTIIEKSFEIISSLEYSLYELQISTSDTVEMISQDNIVIDTNSDKIFTVLFKLTDNADYGKIEIRVNPVSNDSELTDSFATKIYYCVNNGYDYIDLNSFDGLAQFSSNASNMLETINKQSEYFELGGPSMGNIDIGDATIQSTKITVSGYIRWTDSLGVVHPADGVTVYVYDGSAYLGYVTTNSNGYYSKAVSYNGTNRDILIKVWSSGSGISVTDISGATYVYTSNTYSDVSEGASLTISYTANNSTNLGKSFSVQQAMALASRYIYNLEGAYLSRISVSFPDSSRGTSCYVSSSEKIYILEGDAFDWDVLEHEYGHYVQDCYDIEDSPGGAHSLSENLSDDRQNKSEGIRLAWGEGWATYFAINLQNKMSASSLNIPNVGDTSYQDTDDATINYNIEFLPNSRKLGEANEAAVAAVLYDITDPKNSSDSDNIYCGDGNIWNIIKNNNCTTLSEFVTSFYSSGYNQMTKLSFGATLSNYKVAAYLNSSPTGLTTSTPKFTWSKQGGSTTYPNNKFRLNFYDSAYALILSTSYVNSTSQTLNATQWNQVKSCGPVIYCCVETYQTQAPQTGKYNSNLITIDTSGEGIYKITNVGAGKCLNIYGENVSSHYNNQNVCLWSDSGTNEQKWYITQIGDGAYIKSVIDDTFGLNVYRTGDPWNCDLYPISGNETDALVDFILTSNGYKIKLHNYDLYLTAGASSDGSNVYWASSSSSLYQVWSLTAL